MKHHAAASGYDRLQDYIDGTCIHPVERWSISHRMVSKLLSFAIARSGSAWYNRRNLVTELRATLRWFQGRKQIFHFLYGENDFRYLGYLKSVGRGNSIVCTYHTPPEKFKNVVAKSKHLARADASIVISTAQIDLISEIVGQDRVFFVPHGIDVDYFTPANNNVRQSDKLQCLFVGEHLRDLDTLIKTAKLLNTERQISFVVVTHRARFGQFAGLRNVTTLSDVDDLQLRDLYRHSDLLVLPLLDCTANNTLLEAMACGLPVVSTDLQGVRDYVSNDCAILTPKSDARSLANVLMDLSQDRHRLERMAEASRSNALQFRWETIAEQMRQVYSAIAKT